VYPNSFVILSFDLNDFLVKICSMFNNFFIVDQNIMKSRVHPYSLKAFQRFQECKKRHYDFGDMSMTRMQEEAIWFWRYQHD
jgi:ABC-type tungstate transport system permease subunit